MKLVVGLGNPGNEYARTRHNIGFMALDAIKPQLTGMTQKSRFRSDLTEGLHHQTKYLLVAPQTYMNLSGHAVREVRQWYKLDLAQVLVVYDDMDLPFGQLRLRANGSHGGHNGLRSIIEQLGTEAIPRLRVGIGRGPGAATGHVLSRFSEDETASLPALLDRVTRAVFTWGERGIITAMNEANKASAPAATAAKEAPASDESA